MKNVQQYLKEADSERLINEYLYVYPIDVNHVSDETMSVKELKDLVKNNLRKFIERLQTMEIEPSKNGKEYALFAHKVYKDDFAEESHSLVCLQELIENGEQAETYAYEFTKQAEIMGFLVSDATYTQQHLYELLVGVLFAASFFGVEQQDLDKEIQKLEEASESIKKGGKTYSINEIREELDLVKNDRDEKADQLMWQVYDIIHAHNQYYKKKEMHELLDIVLKEKAEKNEA